MTEKRQHAASTAPAMPAHQAIYDLAETYDIAFDFRDLDAECNALDAICETHRGAKPESFCDIACGPGYHCIAYAKRGLRSYGLDLNPTMLDYARRKAERSGAAVNFVLADMRDFCLDAPVDCAFCAMSSFHYLLTNDDIIRHLRAVARNLTPGGLYIVEANHPRDVFRVGKSLKNVWEAQRGDTIVRSHWGYDADPFDPITQTTQTHVHIEVERDGHTRKYDEIEVDRSLTYQEFSTLIAIADVFDTPAWLGVLDVNQPFDNTKQSIRMVPVLRRR
ncbi:MAG TPA: class I SAM-dependent methyltransferase [Acidobacteriota bacterium]|nr:class I SAM-dependent methyltransferase [Acidobacteriota bacterium]